MQALATYIDSDYDDGSITTAVQTAATAINDTALQADGNYKDPFNDTADTNSSSDAMLIAGLNACKQDVSDTSIDALLAYQVLDGTDAGSFNWTAAMTYDRQLSTQQAVYALDQHAYYVNNQGSIFDFSTSV